jgi:hypothetical protein
LRSVTGASKLRALVHGAYGACVVALLGLGCGSRGCSCEKLRMKLLVREAPAERVFSDVEVLGDGTAPRVGLRVARWTGYRYRFVVEGSGSLGLEGQPQAFGPVVVMTLDHEVLRGSADPIVVRADAGVSRLIEERAIVESVRVRQDGVEKRVLDGWNQALLPLRGTAVRQGVTESAGIAWLKSELVGGAKPPEEVRQAVDATLEMQRHFPFRLPPVPVGIGARWRFRESVDLNGAHAAQIAEMSLRAIDAATAVVGIVLRQEAPRQKVPHPFVPGASAMLEQFRGDGEGELTVDRLTAVVLRARLVSTARLTLSDELNGHHEQVTLLGTSIITASSSVITEFDAGAPGPSEAPESESAAAPGAPPRN